MPLKKKITFQNLKEYMKNLALAALVLPRLSVRRLQLESSWNSAFSRGPGGRTPHWGCCRTQQQGFKHWGCHLRLRASTIAYSPGCAAATPRWQGTLLPVPVQGTRCDKHSSVSWYTASKEQKGDEQFRANCPNSSSQSRRLLITSALSTETVIPMLYLDRLTHFG